MRMSFDKLTLWPSKALLGFAESWHTVNTFDSVQRICIKDNVKLGNKMLLSGCWQLVGILSCKLAVWPSEAMKLLKHLILPAHFFPVSNEFYCKLNAFQRLQGGPPTFHWTLDTGSCTYEEKVQKQWVTRFDIGHIQHCQAGYLKRSVQHPKRLNPTSKRPSPGR